MKYRVPPQSLEQIEGTAAALPTVLVVDDEDDIRALVMRALLRAGYRVCGALNAADALAVAALVGPALDLLVTDGIMRPGKNGDVLARTLRESRPTLPVVLMSGSPPSSFNLVALPGVRFLPKPFGIDDLLNTVGALLVERDQTLTRAQPRSLWTGHRAGVAVGWPSATADTGVHPARLP